VSVYFVSIAIAVLWSWQIPGGGYDPRPFGRYLCGTHDLCGSETKPQGNVVVYEHPLPLGSKCAEEDGTAPTNGIEPSYPYIECSGPTMPDWFHGDAIDTIVTVRGWTYDVWNDGTASEAILTAAHDTCWEHFGSPPNREQTSADIERADRMCPDPPAIPLAVLGAVSESEQKQIENYFARLTVAWLK
jgi:hypothetical protein